MDSLITAKLHSVHRLEPAGVAAPVHSAGTVVVRPRPRIRGVGQAWWRRLAALCLAAIMVASCSAPPDDSPAPVTSSPPPVDYQALEEAIETKIMSGSVGWQTIEAVLVNVDGETRIAHYRNGRKPDEALHVWSVTKSVTSA